MNGIARIAAERQRQIDAEGWTLEHDDEHTGAEMALVAALYATPWPLFNVYASDGAVKWQDPWPKEWEPKWDKRQRRLGPNGYRVLCEATELSCEERIRNLEKAGALIAAEIDRLLRREARKP